MIQDKFNKSNVIYRINNDIDLGGETLTIPANCTLDFQGGSFSNGTIVGQNTNIISGRKCFDNIILKNINYINTLWFGLSSANTSDKNTEILNSIINFGNSNEELSIYIPTGNYTLKSIKNNNAKVLHMFGDGDSKTSLKLDKNDSDSIYFFELNINYSTIRDLQIVGSVYNWDKNYVFNNTNTNLIALLKINGFSNIIKDCNFKGSPNHGVLLNSVNNIKFFNCSFLYNWGYGAFNIFTRGVIYDNCWAELNYMGGIIHFSPYNITSYNPSNCISVKGSVTENNGIYGIKGNVKNYKNETFDNQGAWVTLCNSWQDIIKIESTYKGTIDSIHVVCQPCKRKFYTLTQDGTLSFIDNRFNDIIVYKRNNAFHITTNKEFLAGDTIYIHDFQQDCTISNNSPIWEFENYKYKGSMSMNYIQGSGIMPYIKIEDDVFYNYNIEGNNVKVIDNRTIKYNYFSNYIGKGIGKTVYYAPNPTNGSVPNIYFPELKATTGTSFNTSVSIKNTLDLGIIYCYALIRIFDNSLINFYGRDANNEVIVLNSEMLGKIGLTVVEFVYDNTDGNIQMMQVDCGSNNLIEGYGIICSNVRFPQFFNGNVKGSTANRPSIGRTGSGTLYYDTTLNKYICWNGTAWTNLDGTALA